MTGIAKLAKSLLRPVVPEPLLRRHREREAVKRRERQKQQFLDALRPDDVFLVGHPKSGNTWLAYMLAILCREDLEGEINVSNVGDYVPTIHNRDRAIGRFGALVSPRVFRNEAPRFPELYPKTIYILRDPRAAIVSYYHHCVHDTGDTDWAISDFVDEMLEYGCIRRLEPYLVRWDRQVRAWRERAGRQPVEFVRYEDLKADCHEHLSRLARFVGACDDDALVAETVRRGNFKSMRQEEKTYGAESYAGEKGAKGFFVRKGKVDSWREELPVGDVAKIERAFEAEMREFGYL